MERKKEERNLWQKAKDRIIFALFTQTNQVSKTCYIHLFTQSKFLTVNGTVES